MKVVVISPLRVVFLPLATRDGSTRGEDFAPPGCAGSAPYLGLSCEVVVGSSVGVQLSGGEGVDDDAALGMQW